MASVWGVWGLGGGGNGGGYMQSLGELWTTESWVFWGSCWATLRSWHRQGARSTAAVPKTMQSRQVSCFFFQWGTVQHMYFTFLPGNTTALRSITCMCRSAACRDRCRRETPPLPARSRTRTSSSPRASAAHWCPERRGGTLSAPDTWTCSAGRRNPPEEENRWVVRVGLDQSTWRRKDEGLGWG